MASRRTGLDRTAADTDQLRVGVIWAPRADLGGACMEHHNSGPIETGAEMDYREHEKTYGLFLAGAKWGTMATVVLLIAMAVGFLSGGGFLGGLIVFIILNAAGVFLLR
jgi:hypothetical protein